MRYHNDSLMTAVKEAYPEHKWIDNRWKNKPQNYWKDIKNQHDLWSSVARKWEWYEVTGNEAITICGEVCSVMRHHNDSLMTEIAEAYPEHQWIDNLWKNSLEIIGKI